MLSIRNIALAALAASVLAGCGGSSESSSSDGGYIVPSSDPVSSSEATAGAPKSYWPSPNPTPTAPAASPSEVREPRLPSSPCRLVSRVEASEILGGPVEVSIGMLGPTCIYDAPSAQVTLAVGSTSADDLRDAAQRAQRIEVGARSGWCLRRGSTSVAVPLADGSALNVTGPCAMASRFAAQALDRLAPL